MSSKPENAVEAELQKLVGSNRVPGIQYTVVDADGIRFQHQSGMSDVARKTPVAPATTFMASSSTKVITAAAVLKLVEIGKLRLDDPLTAYYAEHPYGKDVTVRHLLAQTSGIPNPLPLEWIHRIQDHDRYDENRELQETMRQNAKLRWIPGEKYGYSNISYWLLGKVIESASRNSYVEYLRKNVFEPLDVNDTEAGFEVDIMRHAVGYQTKVSLVGLSLYLMMDRRMIADTVQGRFSLLPVYMNGPAYGGLICTATGFARFLQDLLRPTPRLFSATTRDLLLTKQLTNGGHDTGMTLGFRTGRLGNDMYYGKPGGGPGFRSNVRIYPLRKIAVAWMANETGVSENEMNSISDLLDRHWCVPAKTETDLFSHRDQ